MATAPAVTVRNVPREALRFPCGPCELKDNGADARTAPFRMVARTGNPIQHWYWGAVVHDMAGMRLHKQRLPIDYIHDDNQQLGYANHFDASTGDLVASGVIQSVQAGDRAEEVIARGKAGHPYEASICFDPDEMLLEEIPEGFTAQVNGRQFQGPGLIVREWWLRSIAVCPMGYDKNTVTELARQQGQAGEQVAVRVAAFAAAGASQLQAETDGAPNESGSAAADTAGEIHQADGSAEAATSAGSANEAGDTAGVFENAASVSENAASVSENAASVSEDGADVSQDTADGSDAVAGGESSSSGQAEDQAADQAGQQTSEHESQPEGDQASPSDHADGEAASESASAGDVEDSAVEPCDPSATSADAGSGDSGTASPSESAEDLRAQLAAAREHNVQLTARLAALGVQGEATPVSFCPESQSSISPQRLAKAERSLPPHLAAIAASIRFPN